ncbi:ParA family protein [Maribacter polysaccharolyticus]|uniref:ParA family protein n=1 Tax=Maribacter polysaccharolyticus TaxID=3020831 RepID=UPI00237F0B7D|nr:ParA family protein [Maribacter polysaccharolyticus]MDE3744048.1 ParA family protein [Maribacter polysaccharolyticus]
MRILIGNQKGGVGKSTLSILLCNYMSIIEKRNVVAIDLDFQQSFFHQWETENQIMDGDPPYKVIKCELSDVGRLLPEIKDDPEYDYLIDSPGNLDNPDILKMLANVDVIIVPFAYEKKTFESTLVYVQVAKHINPNIPLLFLPNRIKKAAKAELKEKVDTELRQFGEISPYTIYDRVDMDRISTRGMSKIQKENFEDFFKFFLLNYIITI